MLNVLVTIRRVTTTIPINTHGCRGCGDFHGYGYEDCDLTGILSRFLRREIHWKRCKHEADVLVDA